MIKVGEERQHTFNKKLRWLRQYTKESNSIDWDASDYEFINYEFETGPRKVYKNFNLSIFVDDYCNANCRFCVAQLRYQNRNLMYQKKHIEDRDKYLYRLERILAAVRPLNPSISLTGGEPTLSPNFVDILKLVDKYGFRKRTITTNGSALLKTVDNSTVVEQLIKYHFNHLNISKVSSDDFLNSQIMNYSIDSPYCFFNNSDLKDVLDITNKSDLHHRISCLLLKESVNSVDKIKRYIDDLQECGANNFIFRELMDYDKSAVNTDKIQYCDANKIKLYDIWQQFDDDPLFTPWLNILGYYYYVEIYKYNHCTVASESADMNIQYREKAANPNIVFEMVFHNNGNLCGSWVDNEDILSEYKGV